MTPVEHDSVRALLARVNASSTATSTETHLARACWAILQKLDEAFELLDASEAEIAKLTEPEHVLAEAERLLRGST